MYNTFLQYGDIGLLSTYYLIGSLLIITLLNKIFKRILGEDVKNINTTLLIIEICIQAGFIGVMGHLLPFIINKIPTPYKYVAEHRTSEIRHAGSAIVIPSILLAFTDFTKRIKEVVARINAEYAYI